MSYPAVFTSLIDPIIGKEGGYTNDPNDSGGETIWGITIHNARVFGYTGPMQAMLRSIAVEIYYQRYFVQPGYDKLAPIDQPIAGKLLDIGINCGPSVGGGFLQRALNALRQPTNDIVLYPALGKDGSVGAVTRAALSAFIAYRGADGRKVLLGMIIALQAVHYMEIVEGQAKDLVFAFGWERARAIGPLMGVA